MGLKLREIKALGEDKYAVTLEDEKGATEQIMCHVGQHKGVTGVRIEPDILMTSEPPRIDGKELAKAVIAYHRSLQKPASESKGNN